MDKLLLAIDQGTSGCKVTFFDTHGNVVASSTGDYKTYYCEGGGVEQEAEDWYRVSANQVNRLVEENNIDPSKVAGIGVDGTSWACIPVDCEGRTLARAMLWLDRRAEKEANWMKDRVGEEKLIALSGNPVDSAYITPKMLWFKNNNPNLYQRAYKFLQSNAFIVYRLTGEYSQDYSQAYGFHYFDMKNKVWDVQTASRLGIALELMAPLRESYEVVGGLTPGAAELMGLVEGIPVVAGGLDAACCTLGAGVINVGQTQEQGGQAGGMSITLEEPLVHEKLILGCHVVPGKWLLQGGTTGGGGTLNWFKRELMHESFDKMSEEADEIMPGCNGVTYLPYMAGERSPLWNKEAKGVYYGLGFDKTRGHIIRSMMEGVAFSLNHNLETAREVGAEVGVMRSVGGSANSEMWTQIKADITRKVIEVPFADHATTLGAAILAGIGVGIYRDFEEAVSKTVKVKRIYRPNEDNEWAYQKAYKQYIKLSELLQKEFWESDN